MKKLITLLTIISFLLCSCSTLEPSSGLTLEGIETIQGEQGIQGPEGPQGEQGIQGIQGIPGENATDDVISRVVYIKVIADDTLLAITDNVTFTIPALLDGMDLIAVGASIYVASSSGLPTFGILNKTDSQEMLSTNITIDTTELTSYTANITAVINTDYDNVSTGEQIKISCSIAGTGTKGFDIFLTFKLP